MVNFKGLLETLLERFTEAHIRCALIGGLALHAAGYMRATGDIDFLVHADDAAVLRSTLAGMGYQCIHEDMNVVHFSAPWSLVGGIDVLLARREYTLRMLSRASIVPGHFPVIIPEDIIGLKVQAMVNDPDRRARDWADIEWLVRSHRGTLDVGLIQEYFDLFARGQEWKALLARVDCVI